MTPTVTPRGSTQTGWEDGETMSGETYDWNVIVDGLNCHLRLRSIPIGMKLFETVAEMEAIPKIRPAGPRG